MANGLTADVHRATTWSIVLSALMLVTGVLAIGLPMILVPGTFGGGHQEENALAMVQAGAAIRIADADLTGETLVGAIAGLDDGRLRKMAAASARTGRRDAAQRVLSVLHEVARK